MPIDVCNIVSDSEQKTIQLHLSVSKLKELQGTDKNCKALITSLAKSKITQYPYVIDNKGILYRKIEDVDEKNQCSSGSPHSYIF